VPQQIGRIRPPTSWRGAPCWHRLVTRDRATPCREGTSGVDPVAEMDVGDGLDALGLEDAPQALADDEGAQVADMQRLGGRSAIRRARISNSATRHATPGRAIASAIARSRTGRHPRQVSGKQSDVGLTPESGSTTRLGVGGMSWFEDSISL
jgi:hypothetical protein